MVNWPLKRFLTVIIALQLALLVLVVSSVTSGFDVPVLRQAIGFICLTFLPGLVILRLLKFKTLTTAETLLYSVGLSLALVMFLGLFINTAFPRAGIAEPISTLPLIISFTAVIILLCVIIYLKERREGSPYSRRLLPNWSEVFSPPVLFLLLLPVLSVLGTYLSYNYGNNILLLVVIGLIALVAALIAFNKFIPERLYALAVVMIAIALLWHRSLISRYLIGDDIHTEYYFQNLVLANHIWNQAIPSNVNAMLSITMLGPIYTLLLNLDIIWILKIVHPLFFAMVPLALFQAFRNQSDDRMGFMATLFFMSFSAFFHDMVELARQQTAEFFFALSILLFVDKAMATGKRATLLIIFGFCVIVSHYGLSYFYLFYLLLAFLLISLTRSAILRHLWTKLSTSFSRGGHSDPPVAAPVNPAHETSPPSTLSMTFVMLIIVFGFAWYLYVSSGSGPVNAIVDIGRQLYSNLSDIFIRETRDPSVLMAIGLASPQAVSVQKNIFLAIQYITQVFIVVGGIRLLFSLRKTKFQPVFIAMTLVSGLLLVMCIILPFFSGFFNISRIYHVTLFLLAFFCILGGVTILQGLRRLVPTRVSRTLNDTVYLRIIAVLILIPYLLFFTGFIYEVTGDTQTSISLAPENFSYTITREQDIIAARWLSEKNSRATIKCDDHAHKILSAYGFFPKSQLVIFNPQDIEKTEVNFVFLSRGNAMQDEILVYYETDKEYKSQRVSLENETLFQQDNKIYDNGSSVYAVRPGGDE